MPVTKTVDITAELSEKRIAAKSELAKEGLHLPLRPKYQLPRLPLNLTDIDDNELMRLFVKFVRYQDHLAGWLVEAEIDENSAETLVEIAKAKHLAHAWTGASTDRVAIAKAEATLDPKVRDYDDALIQCKAQRKVRSVLVESVARDANIVSRELSRRIGIESNVRRENRYS